MYQTTKPFFRVEYLSLSGKKWFKNDLELAETRMPLIQAYLNDLIKIEKIGESYQAQAFFSARPGDPSKDDDNLKIILLNCAEKHLNEGTCQFISTVANFMLTNYKFLPHLKCSLKKITRFSIKRRRSLLSLLTS